MLPVPILPEARYSSSPGHDPSINSPQALPLIKQTIKSAVNTSRKSANRSSGHDPSLGSPTGLPVAVPIHRDIIKTKSQKTAPPGQSSVFSTKDTATGQSHDPCTHTNPRSIRATQKPAGSARLRWRVSMPSPVGIVSSEAINTRPKCLPNCPVTRDVGSPGLDVRQTKSNRPASSPVVSGTAAGNLAFSHASTATQKSGIKSLGKDHKQLPQGLAKQLAVLSGLQLVPSHLSNSPSRRGSPTFSGLELSATRTWSPGPLARSVARNIGVLISSTASAFAAVWQSSLSSSHGSDNVIHKCLSLFGQNLMSAKKSLNWGELEIGYPA